MVFASDQGHRNSGKSRAKSNSTDAAAKTDYSSRLKMRAIPSLKDTRIRGDTIEVYKLISGKERVDNRQFLSETRMRFRLLSSMSAAAK